MKKCEIISKRIRGWKIFSIPHQLICQHHSALSFYFIHSTKWKKHFQYCKKFFIAHPILFTEKRLLWTHIWENMVLYQTHMFGKLSSLYLIYWLCWMCFGSIQELNSIRKLFGKFKNKKTFNKKEVNFI